MFGREWMRFFRPSDFSGTGITYSQKEHCAEMANKLLREAIELSPMVYSIGETAFDKAWDVVRHETDQLSARLIDVENLE